MVTALPLADGYTDIAPGKIAAIATTLEMSSQPGTGKADRASRLVTRRVDEPTPYWYRPLFRRIGEPWLWHSRLRLSDEALSRIIRDDLVEVWAFSAGDHDEGLVELDFRSADTCELAFFGLTPAWTGRGEGRHLMAHAIARAWARPIQRFWVHTCTLDHPAALAFYMRSGFRPVKRQLEIADDPRLDGTLSLDAAPGVPILKATP
jgi:GNAT superfamily N-acetyltransferase